MSSHLMWVGTNCLRRSLTPPLASPGQNVQLWDPLHESEEGCCAFCFSSISSNNGADRVRIMCSHTTTTTKKKMHRNCQEREFQTGFLKLYMFFISSTHPASHDDVSDCPRNVIAHKGKCCIICPLCNEEIPQHVCSGSKPSLCPSNVTQKKERKIWEKSQNKMHYSSRFN